MHVARLHLRHSVGLPALPAIGLLIAGHVLLRETLWRREWLWTFDAFHFVTVLLGPVVAGLGAWEGARFAAAQPVLTATRGRLRALAALWATLCGWVAVAYAAGLTAVSVYTASGPAPGLPGLRVLVTTLPALGLIGMLAAIGVAAGWMTRRYLVAPLVAVVVFVALLFAYMSVPGLFVEVGGATGSGIGLVPRPAVQAAQVLFYAAGTLVALVVAANSGRAAPETRRWVPIAACALLVCGAALLVALGGRRFDRQPVSLVCDNATVPICLAPGYLDTAASVRAAYDPPLEELRATGLPPPIMLSQDPGDKTLGVGYVAPLDLYPEAIVGTLVDAYVPAECDIFRDQQTFELYLGFNYWVSSLVMENLPDDPTVPEAVRSPDPETRNAWAHQAAEQLSTCDD